MPIICRFITAFLLFALAAPACADLSYSQIDIGWYKRDYDDPGNDRFDVDGFRVRLSADIQNSVFFLLSADRLRFKKQEISPGLFIEAEATTYAGGIGYRVPIEEKIHAVIAAEAVRLDGEITLSNSSNSVTAKDDESGWRGSLGVRALPFPKLEVAAGVRYEDVLDGSDTIYELGASLYLAGRLYLLAGADFLDTAKDVRIGLRWEY